MDRCIEASWFANVWFNPYTLVVLLTVMMFLFLSTSASWKARLKGVLAKKSPGTASLVSRVLTLLASVILAAVLAIPVGMLIFVVTIILGFFVFNCTYGALWSRVQPAHEIHAVLKNTRSDGGVTPRTLEELKQLRPEAFDKLEGRAKVGYEYIPDRDGYHFTVQPSRYVIADFTDTDDYVLYRTESIVSSHAFRGNPLISE